MTEVERKSKGIDAPKCKVCEKRHWGVCTDQSSGGYIGATIGRPVQARAAVPASAVAQKLAKATAPRPKAGKPHRKAKARKS